jgi:phenylacetate-CoA ligase
VTDNLHRIRSAVAGMVWPGLPDQAGSQALAMQYQLGETQWWSPDELERHQLRQARLLIKHAAETVPFHHARLAGFDPGAELTMEGLRALPRMTRADVQAQGRAVLSTAVPPEHGQPVSGETSGSTGRPVTYVGTELTRFFWRAFNLRDHLWHERDLGATMAAIRKVEDREQGGWGPSLDVAFQTGRVLMYNLRHDLDEQLDWLRRGAPAYLITNAYNVYWLARRSLERGLALPGLREALCFGGTFPEDARAVVRRAWNVGMTDVYTAEEVGYIALQCPGHEH